MNFDKNIPILIIFRFLCSTLHLQKVFVFVQLFGGPTAICASLCGFNDTTNHGWHVHEIGSTADRCAAAGGHFNPDDLQHGAPDDDIRSVTRKLMSFNIQT